MCFSSQQPQAPNYKPDYSPENSQVAVKSEVKDAATNTVDGQIASTSPPPPVKTAMSGANTNFLRM